MKFAAALSFLLFAPSVDAFATNKAKAPALDCLKSTPFSYNDRQGPNSFSYRDNLGAGGRPASSSQQDEINMVSKT